MIKAVLFDVDGTLIRTGGAGAKAFELALASEFGVRGCVERVAFAGRTDLSLVRELFSLWGIQWNEENRQRFFRSYLSWLPRVLPQHNGMALPGAVKFLDYLESRTPRPLIGLLTGNIQKGAEIKLLFYGLWHRFQMGAYGDEHEDRSEIASIALKRVREILGSEILPQEILIVGDTPHDIACAKYIGARSLAVTTGGASRSKLADCQPDWLVDDLGEFTFESHRTRHTQGTLQF